MKTHGDDAEKMCDISAGPERDPAGVGVQQLAG